MRFARTLAAAVSIVLAGLPAAAQPQATDDLANLKTQLVQMKVNPFPPARERTAQLISALIRRMDVTTIDTATIDEMAGLLEDNSDAVRGRIAISLGNIGGAAKHTAPALEKAFAKAKDFAAAAQLNQQPYGNRNYGIGTSADSICFALMRLEAAIPEGCVEGRYQPTPPAPEAPADGTIR